MDTAALTGLLQLFCRLFLEIRLSVAYSVFEGLIFSRMKYSARGFVPLNSEKDHPPIHANLSQSHSVPLFSPSLWLDSRRAPKRESSISLSVCESNTRRDDKSRRSERGYEMRLAEISVDWRMV